MTRNTSKLFQPTLPMRGATCLSFDRYRQIRIPTHAPHAGSDVSKTRTRVSQNNSNPRSPCGERPSPRISKKYVSQFQPTLPMRGATTYSMRTPRSSINSNPRSPCGERLDLLTIFIKWNRFQPTLPMRGATSRWNMPKYPHLFQPTLPMRGATCLERSYTRSQEIPTHAPQAGSDEPCLVYAHATESFQPTLPMRGATLLLLDLFRLIRIPTHAPHAGSDMSEYIISDKCLIPTHAPHAGSDRGYERIHSA